jgi:hypothetical protein
MRPLTFDIPSDPTLCREAGAAFALDKDRTYASFDAMAAAEAARSDRIEVAGLERSLRASH